MSAPTKRRRHHRMAAAIRVSDAKEPEAGPWLTRDISVSGLFLLAPHLWKVGDEVMLVLEHGVAQLRVLAEVTQIHPEGVGFRFENTMPAFRAGILDIMNDRFDDGDGWQERRTEPRWEVERSVLWRAYEEHAEHGAEVLDINTSGAALQSVTLPDVEDEIYLLLPVEGRGADEPRYTGYNGCRARVVSRGSSNFGVEFIEPPEEFRDFILSLVGEKIQ